MTVATSRAATAPASAIVGPMLTVHRAERADRLVDALAAVLVDPLDDPFTPEVVAVPTRGIERWLTQRLSTALGTSPGRRDGVCANVEFPFPGRLVGGAMAAATGVDPDDDPWLPERAVWPLLAVVDEHLDDAWMAALAAHLGGAATIATRRCGPAGSAPPATSPTCSTATASTGPRWSRRGRAATTPTASAMPSRPTSSWQATLWRRLRERLGVPSPAERLAAGVRSLRDEPDLVDLPPRLSLFGLTRLPASHVDVLEALAAARDVHLFLLHPSPALWERISDDGADHGHLVRRRDDPTAATPRNPLLATWGRDAREMQLVIGAARRPTSTMPTDAPADTLLRRIQADIRARRGAPGPPCRRRDDAVLDPADDSVQVHACHGRARQVEVLRDAILHLLADDPTLEPRDVIVMCPDIETFAPLIHATFGAADVDAVAPARRPCPTCGSASPTARCARPTRSSRSSPSCSSSPTPGITASQLVDFAGREPVRRRFRLDDDDLARVEEWVAATGHPLGARRRPPGAVPARRARCEHLAGRARPAPARRDHDRGRPAARRRRAAARRRRQRRHRPRRPVRRARRPAPRRRRRALPAAADRAWADADRRGGRRPRRDLRDATRGSAPSSTGSSATS